jgi:hypothetical protein
VKVELVGSGENSSYFHTKITNREQDKKILPMRAFRKTQREFDGLFINEALIPISSDDLPSNKEGYDLFNRTIEPKLSKKIVKDKINIITFFGEKKLELKDLLSFEDINLLTDFNQRYNDHFVSLPFTLKFRDKATKPDDIYNDIKSLYGDFASTLKQSNLLGYVPAYSSFREISKFVDLYIDNNQSIKSDQGQLNFVPLMIDCKATSPDHLMRSLAKLSQIKNEYIKEGFYLFYYGFNPRIPVVNRKKNNETLAKEFLLSYLGFDVIGGSYALMHGGGPTDKSPEKSVGIFSDVDFKYHLETVKPYDYDRTKQRNFLKQNTILNGISSKLSRSPKAPLEELQKRKDAFEYVQLYQ